MFSIKNKLIKTLKSFGNDGLDWLRKARGLNISSYVITNLSKLDGFADKMDEILELIKKSSRSADEVAECIKKYGDDAVDAVEVIGKYGDDAVDRLKQGNTPEEIEKELWGEEVDLKVKYIMEPEIQILTL